MHWAFQTDSAIKTSHDIGKTMRPGPTMQDSTLVIVSHKRHLRDGDSVFVKGGFLTITNEFARHFARVLLCVPVEDRPGLPAKMRYRKNVQIVALPSYAGRVQLIRQLPQVISRLWDAIRSADIAYLMCPNDLGVLGLTLAHIQRKRTFTSFDTDRAKILGTRHYGPLTYALKHRIVSNVLYPYMRRLAGPYPAFVTGDMYLGNFPDWYQWVKTTHTSADMVEGPLTIRSLPENIVFAGRLSPEKNLSALIEAFGRLRDVHPQLKLNIFGDGACSDMLKHQTLEAGLESRVSFRGFQPSTKLLKTRFGSADLLVLPSTEERQGKVLLEAMACGIPVAASRIGGIPSVIDDGVNGVLFDPHSIDDIANKIDGILSNTGRRQQIAIAGFEFAQKHSLDKEVEKLVSKVAEFYQRRGSLA